jgi:restriction system protein
VSRIKRLTQSYSKYVSVPWRDDAAAAQRVIFCVYQETEELRLRAKVDEFEIATRAAGHDWAVEDLSEPGPTSREDTADSDLDELARDQIASLISARFKGHGLTRLIEGILKAQGYTTYRSPEGADGGADILAGSGPLGFSAPRLCIEVKSEDNPIGREPVDKLLGAMTKFNADQGLFVAWGGFKGNVQKEMASQFFRLRLWTQKEILEQLFEQYDRLDEDLKAELPLKRVWMVTSQEEIL